MNSQSADDMYGRVFPGEKWTISFDATDEQASAMTAHVAAHTDDSDERLMFLQMLGLADYVPAFNPTARDAWTKKPVDPARTAECRNGHLRSEHTSTTSGGKQRCGECKRLSNARYEKKRSAWKAAA